MKHKRWFVVAFVAMAVLATGSIVWAADSRQPQWLQGRVVEIGDASLTVETPADTIVVSITTETQFRVPGVADAGLSDITVDSPALIRLRADSDADNPVAQIVVIQAARARLAERLAQSFVRGTVTAVSGDRVSVQTAADEMVTLLITGTTYLWTPGEPPTTTVKLSVGDPVLAVGQPLEPEGDGRTIAARLVVVVGDEDLPKILIRGKIVAVTRQTLVVDTGRAERAITVLPRTRLWSARGRLNSASDLLPGDTIIALGQPTELGQWFAGFVLVPNAQPAATQVRGQVLAKDVDAGTLTVKTARGVELTVFTDGEHSLSHPRCTRAGLSRHPG
jgi:RNase P/RNase MRP subunit p29